MDATVARIIEAWGAIDDRFARVRAYPWGAVVADPRYPDLLLCNMARVGDDGPLTLADVEAALGTDAPHAAKRAAVVFSPEARTDLIAEMGAAGGLFFDHVLVAGDAFPDGVDVTPEDRRVEEADPDDPEFWRGLAATQAQAFGIRDPDVRAQLAAVEREVFIPAGKRWFVVRDRAGEVAAMAAVFPSASAAEIDHVATVPAARRRGHASALVARCVAEARAGGAQEVFLLTEQDGAAERVYRRLGFTPVATFAGWVLPADR